MPARINACVAASRTHDPDAAAHAPLVARVRRRFFAQPATARPRRRRRPYEVEPPTRSATPRKSGEVECRREYRLHERSENGKANQESLISGLTVSACESKEFSHSDPDLFALGEESLLCTFCSDKQGTNFPRKSLGYSIRSYCAVLQRGAATPTRPTCDGKQIAQRAGTPRLAQ